MSANPSADPCGTTRRELGEAVYFGAKEGRLFGWLHRPSELKLPSNVGLVICNPFGYEAICTHRSVRALADAAAALGVPALRFDYLGTGDSAELHPEADQITEWSENILAAIDELRLQTGVERVILAGFRLGALLAAVVAGRVAGLAGIAVIAPVIGGQRYLRELRTARMAAALGLPADQPAIDPASSEARGPRAGSLEFSGFSLSSASLLTLKSVDLMQLEAPQTDVLVIDGTSLPLGRAWSDRLDGLGISVQYTALPGIVEMVVTAPQYAVTSPSMIGAFSEWLAQRQRRVGSGAQHAPGVVDAPACLLSLPGISPSNRPVVERPIFFGTEALLFGIITEPSPDEKRRRAVILLNAGADHHIGVSRLHVPLARRWARNGYFVLRMDLAGIGDSATRNGNTDDEVFPPAAIDDIRAAIDYLTSHYGIRDVALAGLCSGAYHALRAAIAGAAVSRILMVNPQNYFWKDGMELEDLQFTEVIRNPAVYRKRVVSGDAWKRLLKGQVNVLRIFHVLLQRGLLPLEATLRNLARRVRIRLPSDLGWELETLTRRGVQVVMVFAHGEPGIDLLKMQAGSSIERLGDSCRVRIIDSGDHTFSQLGPRTILQDVLSAELFAEPISSPRFVPLAQGGARQRDAVG